MSFLFLSRAFFASICYAGPQWTSLNRHSPFRIWVDAGMKARHCCYTKEVFADNLDTKRVFTWCQSGGAISQKNHRHVGVSDVLMQHVCCKKLDPSVCYFVTQMGQATDTLLVMVTHRPRVILIAS